MSRVSKSLEHGNRIVHRFGLESSWRHLISWQAVSFDHEQKARGRFDSSGLGMKLLQHRSKKGATGRQRSRFKKGPARSH